MRKRPSSRPASRSTIWLAWFCAFAAWLVVLPCSADEKPSALLLQSAGADRTLREIVARLRGELTALGFVVTLQELDLPPSTHGSLARLAEAERVTAVILARRAGDDAIELWIADRVLGLTSNSRLSREASDRDGARRLAVEAAELLRARIAELLIGQPQPAPAPEPVVPPHVAPEPAWRARLEVGAGASLLFRTQAWDTGIFPELGLALAWARDTRAWHAVWGMAAHAYGYGTTISRSTDEGALRARQGAGVFAAFVRAESAHVVTPELSLGVGAYGVGVHGRSDAPFTAHDAVSISPLVAGGLAVQARLVSWLSARLAFDWMYATHKSSLRIAQREVARSGGALGALHLTLVARVW